MKFIKENSSVPIFKQIVKWMTDNIDDSTWSAGFKLPSEEDLSRELGVSRGTVRKAIKELVKEQLLEQIQGKGTFVSHDKITSNFAQEFISFAESMESNDLQYVTKVLEQKVIKPSKHILDTLGCESDTPILYLKRVRYVNDEIVILIENWINTKLCPKIETSNFEENTLFNMIEESSKKAIKYGIRSFEARNITEEQSIDLDVDINLPVLFLAQKTFIEENQIAEYSNVLLRSDKHKIVSVLKR